MTRTTLSLDDDVVAAARVLARAHKRSLGSVISELARRGLIPRPAAVHVDEGGLPVFSVRPDAPVFGPDEVARGLDEP
ncbi:antitoxin [soil metagenome]|jgi:hypothetical protein|nr:antitoxin [Euzebyaceae bacterium]